MSKKLIVYVGIEKSTEYPVGWYFLDEASQLNGPFDCNKEAEEHLKRYAESLESIK